VNCLVNRKENEAPLVVVRLKSIASAKLAESKLREARDKNGLQCVFEVLSDTDSEGFSLRNLTPYWAEHFRTVLGKSEIRSFEDLEGMPCLLFVVDKARMGDTFPKTFAYFDLRTRYVDQVNSLSTLEQDLGRACGYGKRPKVLVSSKCLEIVKDRTKVVRPDPYVEWNENEDTDESESDFNKFLTFFKLAKNNCYGKIRDWHRRFLLTAQPQCGKTAVFIEVIKTFMESFSQSEIEQDVDLPDGFPQTLNEILGEGKCWLHVKESHIDVQLRGRELLLTSRSANVISVDEHIINRSSTPNSKISATLSPYVALYHAIPPVSLQSHSGKWTLSDVFVGTNQQTKIFDFRTDTLDSARAARCARASAEIVFDQSVHVGQSLLLGECKELVDAMVDSFVDELPTSFDEFLMRLPRLEYERIFAELFKGEDDVSSSIIRFFTNLRFVER
jgi:hypothetical protein